jgi:hypothetical protein
LAQLPPAGLHAKPGEKIEVDVDLSASSGFTVEVVGERVEARYRMAFNQLTEGWSWRRIGRSCGRRLLPVQIPAAAVGGG